MINDTFDNNFYIENDLITYYQKQTWNLTYDSVCMYIKMAYFRCKKAIELSSIHFEFLFDTLLTQVLQLIVL